EAFRVVTPGSLATLGARLREGRLFMEMDRENTRPVIVVNETFADRHWPGRSALGHGVQINARGPDSPWIEIVGVVKEIRERGIDIDTKPAIYMALAQGRSQWPRPFELAAR